MKHNQRIALNLLAALVFGTLLLLGATIESRTYKGTQDFTGATVLGISGGGITFSPPYVVSGANKFLPFGFQATIPPTTGWTAANTTSGCTFQTVSQNGVISIINAGAQPTTAVCAQRRPISGTTTLIAAMSVSAAESSNDSFCGVGAQNSSSGFFYGENFWNKNNSDVVAFAEAFTNYTTLQFPTQSLHGLGAVTFFKLTWNSGTGNIDGYVSTDGGNIWVHQDNRNGGSPFTGFDNWIFYSSGSTSSNFPSYCNLLSWSVQ